MPGVLAATSFPNRTSPVKRGVWVLEKLLGDHVPAAPPDVPALANQDKEIVATLTLRKRTELHRTNPVCANCHKLLDPIGFGLGERRASQLELAAGYAVAALDIPDWNREHPTDRSSPPAQMSDEGSQTTPSRHS